MSTNHFLLAALSAAIALPALAQDSTKSRTLDEVVITATKYPIKQSLTGKVITVITREEIVAKNGITLGQLLNQQPGVIINGALNSPGTNQSIYTRGAATGRTLILIDGIPAYDPSLINNEFDINLLSINDIQRIEICRGAQSTLYGSDAIAGVINIITIPKDASKPFHLNSTVAAGNLGTFKGNAKVYGKVGRFDYSVGYSKLNSDGFSSARDTTGKKGFDRDGYHGNITNAQASYAITEQLRVKAFMQYNQYKSDIDASAFTDDRDFTINNKNLIAGSGFQYKKEGLAITGNYQYSEIRRNYIDDSAHVGGFSKYSKNDYYGKSQFMELYASIGLGSGFTLLQGGDYRFSGMNNQYLSISSFGPYTSGFKDTVMSQASLYASLNYQSKNSRLNIELGGRMNVHSRYGNNSTYTFNPSFALSDKFRVFGSIATGFKAPSLYQLYDAFSGNRNLKAESSTNYEFGVQQTQEKFTERVVFFYREIDNGIDYNNVIQRYFNFFKQQARGIEYEIAVRPAKYLNITANYTWTGISENTQSRIALNKDTTYKYALRRPAHSVNANVEVFLTPDLSVSANFKYVSSRKDVGGYRVPDFYLSDYAIFGGHAAWRINKVVSVFGDLQNITNRKFFDLRGYNSIPFVNSFGATVNL
jgi:vitamin B12 transporter